MVGGGPHMSPGEVTRADHGVLFLDELPEFGRDVLESLRQPLEDGYVSIARVGRATRFPARVLLVAAMNPCPCGWAGDPSGRCTCGPNVPERYAGRVSGPLRDRIDLSVAMRPVAPAALIAGREPESSAVVAARIADARARQLARQGTLNGRLAGRRLRAACGLGAPAARRAVALAELEGLTGRGTVRLLRVARTIADLAGRDVVATHDLDEAARFRTFASQAAAREAS
jgi:magnesium chelatase family protein